MSQDGFPRNSRSRREVLAVVLILAVAAGVSLLVRLMVFPRNDVPGSTGNVPRKYFMKADSLLGAIERGNIERVRVFIEQGVDLNTVPDDDFQCSLPLSYAVYCGQRDIVKLLLEAGASPNAYAKDVPVGFENNYPLTLAITRGDMDLVELLLESGADPSLFAEDSGPALHLVVAAPGEVMPYLLDHGAEIDAPDRLGRTALHMAAEVGSEQSLKLLISHGANLNARDVWGRTPLHVCIGKTEPTTILLEAGANSDIGADMTYPLSWSQFGLKYPEPPAYRLPGPDDEWDASGWTVLHCGAAIGDKTYVELLLEHGAGTDITDAKGRTPMDIAKLEGNDDIVTLIEEWIEEHQEDDSAH